MKLFSLALSVAVFFISLYYFIVEIDYGVKTFNDVIYTLLLLILMTICVTGVIINWNALSAKKRRKNIYLFVSNSFSTRKK